MKKIIFSVMSAFCFLAFAQSCNRQEDLPPDASAKDEKEPTSVISLMEKEKGITFFKKDVILKDANGSEITMRFASEKKEHLDMYLAMHEFSLNSSFKESGSVNVAPSTEMPVNKTNATAPDLTDAIHVIRERVEVKLADGIKNYSLTTTIAKSLKNAKVSYTPPYYVEDISPMNRPDGYKFDVQWDMCWLLVDFRESWYNPNWIDATVWLQIYPTTNWGNGVRIELGTMPNPYQNGCWVARAKIHYNTAMSGNNYTSQWQS